MTSRAALTSSILLLLVTLTIRLAKVKSSDQDQKSSPTLRPLSSFQQSYAHRIPSDQAVNERGRRDIEASVKAHGWPSTIFSPLCEAWAYFEAGGSIGKSRHDADNVRDNASNEASWKYLDALVENRGIPSLDAWISNSNKLEQDGDSSLGDSSWTYANSTKLAIKSASSSSSSLDKKLLPLALALRAHMPHCEMHRSLARDVAIHFGLYDLVTRAEPPAAFCVVSRVSSAKEDEKQMVPLLTKVLADAALLPPALKVLEAVKTKQDEMELNKSSLLLPLPEESYHPDVTRKIVDEDDLMLEDEDVEKKEVPKDIVAVLYGQIGTSAFASFYKSLRESRIKFVVRHMGHITYEEEMQASEQRGHGTLSSTQSPLSRAIPTALQGYGVRLDIRNVEYKAFDDGPNEKSKDGDSEQNQPDWNDSEHHPDHPARNEYLAGINLKTIMARLDPETDTHAPLPQDLQSLQTALLQSHPAQLSSESIVPPAWKRRSLSLQAATVIASSSDPLETLKGISQNLPSIAHSLSSVSVADSLKNLAEEATDVAAKVGAVSPGWGDAAFGFYVNSREVNVERPSFNVFQLLDVLREEDKKLGDLEGTVRPMLERTMEVLMGEGRGKGKAFNILKTIRKGMDMGVEKLVQYGKKKNEALVNDQDNEDDDEDDEAESTGPSSKKYRIDVGRGGKKAVLYLNDLEKDPEYQSWPNVQEMMMRMQFGQGPTVRRNLFTMLIVLDPASGNAHPAINVLPHLVNSQFPVRIGLLVVSRKDVAQKKPSKPGPWDFGNRPFHPRDSLNLMRHISKRYGGMAAMSCLINVFQPHSGETLSVGDYIQNHVSLLSQIGVVPEDEEEDARQEMELLLKSPTIDDGYDDAFDFATQKLISPGMSFFNGIPFPDASDSAFGLGVNEVLRYEQQHVISLVMQGAITDLKPRSVYANLLSGDNCYKQFHPVLRGSEIEYAPMLKNVNDQSLIFPSAGNQMDIHNVDAFFVIEAVLNFDTIDGVNAALDFFDMMQSAPAKWHYSKTVSVAFRVVSNPRKGDRSGDPTKAVGYASLFCLASRFDIKTLKRAFEIIHENKSFITAWNQFKTSGEFDKETGQSLADAVSKMPQCSNAGALDKDNYYTVNGRLYPIEGPFGPFLNEEDIKMLLSVEMDRNVGMTRLIAPKFLGEPGKSDKHTNESTSPVVHNAIALSATALNHVFSTSVASKPTSLSRNAFAGIADVMDSLASAEERNPLYFSWNEESAKKRLQVEVSVILDPLTEPTQRVAPLLLTIRDFLKLPLRLMIAPRQVVENDLPLSSYYRFAIDPLAVPDENPPTALFSNLPSNHLLTVRMDVPEPWDLQQAFSVQDADNLRCDARYGCGDEAYLLANAGGEIPEGTQAPNGRIELTRMEYTLKSLLFFGQCYDASTNSPPNGLQLTLDRSKLKDSSSNSVNEMQVEIDGSTFRTSHGDGIEAPTSPHDHTDTLVMKTVGYWQLRANPGIWTLQIEKNSRGAEIYHMIDGSVSPSGRLSIPDNPSEFISKSLIMKDFSNHGQTLLVKRNKGHETSNLFPEEANIEATENEGNEVVHVFSLATGHAYERLLKIMMLSVTKRTKSPVKFWLFENFLSPSFKSSALYMAERIGCQLEFVTYKWPEWLRGQSEKQRLIWGYKILFLDVLFPLDVKKIIYVDADQVVRGDMTELWNLDLKGAPYGYTPFCDSREETLGYQFWRSGFWKNHLRGKPYHISALYVVDLDRFRRELVGDKLRATYQQLSADPNSLANLDQDLPNYAQHDVRIFSLPQKWLWCESWCSDETKAEAMTIDLCNNPLHKEAKISMAKRIISGELFEESWEELDAEVERYYQEFLTLTK